MYASNRDVLVAARVQLKLENVIAFVSRVLTGGRRHKKRNARYGNATVFSRR